MNENVDQATEVGMRLRAAQGKAGSPSPTPTMPAWVSNAPQPSADPDVEERFRLLQEGNETRAVEIQALIQRLDGQTQTLMSVSSQSAENERNLLALQQKVDALAADPNTPDWMSLDKLITIIAGVIAVVTTIGSAFASIDPRVPIIATAVTAVLTTVMGVMQGLQRKEVAVERVKSQGRMAEELAHVQAQVILRGTPTVVRALTDPPSSAY